MDLTPPLNTKAIARTFLLANTPSYLYRHLRAEQSVAAFARANTAQSIAALVRSQLSVPPGTAINAPLVYALLAAITLAPPPDSHKAIASLDISNLEWGEAFRAIFSATTPLTAVHLVPPPLGASYYEVRPVSHSSTGTASVTFPPEASEDKQ